MSSNPTVELLGDGISAELSRSVHTVIVCPDEYGEFLSDAACGLIGPVGLGDNAAYAFDADGEVTRAMFDPAGGSAPGIAGKHACHPSAALLALANLPRHIGEQAAGRGSLSMTGFTAVVAERLRSALAEA